MSDCRTCRYRRWVAATMDGEFRTAAALAVRQQTPKNMAALEKARGERDEAKRYMQQHAAECQGAEAVRPS